MTQKQFNCTHRSTKKKKGKNTRNFIDFENFKKKKKGLYIKL